MPHFPKDFLGSRHIPQFSRMIQLIPALPLRHAAAAFHRRQRGHRCRAQRRPATTSPGVSRGAAGAALREGARGGGWGNGGTGTPWQQHLVIGHSMSQPRNICHSLQVEQIRNLQTVLDGLVAKHQAKRAVI